MENLSLKDLEKIAYQLQIDYNPPLKEKDRSYIIKCINSIKEDGKKLDEDTLIKRRETIRKRNNIICETEDTLAGDRVGLLSDAQLLFVPTEINKDEFYCFDRIGDHDYLEAGTNPYTNIPFSEEQMKIIKKQSKYPTVDAEEFFNAYDKIFGAGNVYQRPEYIVLAGKLRDELEKGYTYIGDLDGFSRLPKEQIQEYMSHFRIEIDAEDRDEAAVEALKALSKIYEESDDKRGTAYIIGNSVEEYMLMIRENLTYEQLKNTVREQENADPIWKPQKLYKDMTKQELRNIFSENLNFITEEKWRKTKMLLDKNYITGDDIRTNDYHLFRQLLAKMERSSSVYYKRILDEILKRDFTLEDIYAVSDYISDDLFDELLLKFAN